MTNNEIIKILNEHIKDYDLCSDDDWNTINAMKNCVNALSDEQVYSIRIKLNKETK